MDKVVREKLTQIIEAEGDRNWWNPRSFDEHIRPQLPTELKIISVPPTQAENFNCFVYALGLENDSEFLGGKNPIQQEFIRCLLSQDALQKIENPSTGDLIFYEGDQHIITHGGIAQSDGAVLSKWMWGPIFHHALWDVPSSFGEEVFYCMHIEAELAKKLYLEYKDIGVQIDPIS